MVLPSSFCRFPPSTMTSRDYGTERKTTDEIFIRSYAPPFNQYIHLRWICLRTLAWLSCLLLIGAGSWNHLHHRVRLEPKTSLSWWTCPDDSRYQCVYLEVPLNYVDPIPDELVSIFIRKFPATARPSERLGSLLVNPGGPGGSGNLFILEIAESISAIVQGKYDILSWDPRGVNMTTPALGCYTADSQSVLLQLSYLLSGTPLSARGPSHLPERQRDLSEFMFMKHQDEYLKVPAMACDTFGNKRMLKAVTTNFVVNDIVNILDALGPTETGLNFWGFSYGTILGTVFAAKNPHLVNRMLLDGVSDSIAYSNNLWDWGRNGIQDARKTADGFFDECAEAGPTKCAFAAGLLTSSPQQRYAAIFERLLEAPIPVASKSIGMGVFKASDLQELFFETMYHPKSWTKFAQGLADLERGDATILYETAYTYFSDIRRTTDPDKNVFHRHVEKYGSFLWTLAIMCTDGPSMNARHGDEGVKEYLDYLHELLEISPTGEGWGIWFGFCRHWKVEPFERFTVKPGLQKTRFPILFLSMTADPVTPLSSAKKMSSAFQNDSAVLLIQEGYGHTSFAQPSLCTAKAIREYFVKGVVPMNGTTCQADPGGIFLADPFYIRTSKKQMTQDDRDLLEAFEKMSEVTNEHRFGLGVRKGSI